MEALHLMILFFLLLSPLLLYIFLTRKGKGRKPNLPPGPRPLPLIGNLHLLSRDSLPSVTLRDLSLQYGPILHLTLGEVSTVIISSARLARDVLRTHDLPLCSRPKLYSADKLFYGSTDMAFAPYGPYWRHVRKITIIELLSTNRVNSYSSVRGEEAARLVERISASSSTTTTVNLTQSLAQYANTVLCRAAFGRDFVEEGRHEKQGFHHMLEEYQSLLGGFSVGDFFPSLEWIHAVTGLKKRLEWTFQRFDGLFNEIIEERLERRRLLNMNKRGEGGENKDLMDVLLDLKEKDEMEMPLTIDNIKAIILDMFAAGTDTSFVTLDWAMTELIMNPDSMQKAQSEIRSILGERRTVVEADLHQMHYLKAVIKETMRLHPPAQLLVPRESTEPTTIAGYDIPAKTRIYVNAWAIGRDPESWEKPEKFMPERFIGSSIDYKGQDFEFIPFGSGRRICPGINFAAVSLEMALSHLLHSFDWELPPGTRAKDLDLTEHFGISTQKAAQLLVVAKPYLV